jgi:hypothetical protein
MRSGEIGSRDFTVSGKKRGRHSINRAGGSCRIRGLVTAIVVDHDHAFYEWVISKIYHRIGDAFFVVIGGEGNNDVSVGYYLQCIEP